MSSAHTHDLAAIESMVRFRGDYQNVRKFPSSDVRREIQKSFGEFWELINSVHQGYFDTETTLSTVTSQRFIELPSDVWSVKGIDRLDGSDYRELRQVGVAERNRFGANTGTPCAYRLSSRGVELQPTPDAVYTLRIVYTPKAPSLLEAKSRDWFNGWDDYVIESTLMKLDRREGKPLVERERALAEIAGRIKAGASERRQQEPEYLVVRETGDVGLPWPWGDID